jgi:ABC-type multidrug transport system permease subunit
VLFAVVIAPALKDALGGFQNGVDYAAFVAVATMGLLIPLNTMFSGIGVIIDRESGAQRELLAAPIHRPLVVLGNLAVALAVTGLQLAALIGAALLRGIDFQAGASGVAWFVAAAALLAIGMYGIAETLANRIPRQEEYVGALPAPAIVPWFFAGSLFPISALPEALTWIAKCLPLTHALALMRYGCSATTVPASRTSGTWATQPPWRHSASPSSPSSQSRSRPSRSASLPALPSTERA